MFFLYTLLSYITLALNIDLRVVFTDLNIEDKDFVLLLHLFKPSFSLGFGGASNSWFDSCLFGNAESRIGPFEL